MPQNNLFSLTTRSFNVLQPISNNLAVIRQNDLQHDTINQNNPIHHPLPVRNGSLDSHLPGRKSIVREGVSAADPEPASAIRGC